MCHPCAIMWEADVPPAVGRIVAAPSLASLDQGLLGHLIWYEVCICLGLSKFSFSYRNIVGTGGFSGRAIMWPWDVVLLDMPSGHSHSWFASSPLHPPSHLPIQLGLLLPLSTCHLLTHSTPPGLAVLCSHQALKASAQYFGLVCFFPSPLPLVHSLTLPQQVSSAIHGLLVVWVIWVFIECES